MASLKGISVSCTFSLLPHSHLSTSRSLPPGTVHSPLGPASRHFTQSGCTPLRVRKKFGLDISLLLSPRLLFFLSSPTQTKTSDNEVAILQYHPENTLPRTKVESPCLRPSLSCKRPLRAVAVFPVAACSPAVLRVNQSIFPRHSSLQAFPLLELIASPRVCL